MGFSYNGLGVADPMAGGFSLGVDVPMAPISSGSPTTNAATQAANAASPVTPSGSANPAVPAGATGPQFNPITGEQLNPGFFQKGGGFSVALGALQTLGNLWNSFQQVKIAKDTLNFQKQAYQTNLTNTTKDYNTKLANDATVSGQISGWSQEKTDQYIKDHSL